MNPVPDVQRILVPHDFSDAAERALDYAVTLAKKFGARITLMHAYEIPSLGYPEALVASLEFSSDIERVVGKALEAIAARARRSDVEIDAVLRLGRAWTEILTVAEQTRADLVVMGTHGRKGVSRALLGSVAEKIVRTA